MLVDPQERSSALRQENAAQLAELHEKTSLILKHEEEVELIREQGRLCVFNKCPLTSGQDFRQAAAMTTPLANPLATRPTTAPANAHAAALAIALAAVLTAALAV